MANYCRVHNVFQKNIDDSLCLLKDKDKFVYKLNETASFLWEILDKDCSIEKLVKSLSKKYKISHTQAQKDVEQFLAYYLKEGLIKKVSI